ncbi:MAG: hypothetical protein ACE5JX_06660 [Acidobacteriota bacterium]
MSVEVKEVCQPCDLEGCVQLQRRVWGFDERDIVSVAMLRTCRGYGGLLLGAWLPEAGLVGFVFSFPALLGKRTIQHSHMLAVLEPFRDQGIGQKLKWAQYRQASDRGIGRITWTFDPLEARNGNLNLNKLGAVVRRYHVNLYGEGTSSDLHKDLGTDRFLAEWEVAPQPPQGRPGWVDLDRALSDPQTLLTRRDRRGLLVPSRLDLHRGEPWLAVEIPARIQKLKTLDPDLAGQWRRMTRAVFRHYLKIGYEVVGVRVSRPGGNRLRTFYRLRRENEARGHED